MSGVSGSMKPETFYEAFLKKCPIINQDSYTVDPDNSWFTAGGPSRAELVCTMAKP